MGKAAKKTTKKIIPKPKSEYNFAEKVSRLIFSLMKRKKNQRLPSLCLNVDQYLIKGYICEGTFGQVLVATNIHTNVEAAAKLEDYSMAVPQLVTEYKIYELLGSDQPGFIKIFYYGAVEKLYNVLIMELLGPDLDDLLGACNNIFSYKTVLMIAIQTLKLLKHIHSKQIIYRDVKPENFCIGNRLHNKEKIIHIIDFGLSKIQKPDQFNQMPVVQYNYLVGTARYMSINAHNGVDQSKRDDLESLGYMYIYFLRGKLPWMGLSSKEHLSKHYRTIAEIKQKITPDELAANHSEFKDYIVYVKRLQFREDPDYDYLIKLMQIAMTRAGFNNDSEFDWTEIMKKKFLQDNVVVDADE